MAQYAITEERERILRRHPDYRVDLEPEEACVTARAHGRVLAETRRPVRVRESFHEPVWYFPRDDVDFSHLERSEHATRCPFKGDASYWSLRLGDGVLENVAWSYEAPMPEVAGLEGLVAFYESRVEVTPRPA